METFFLFLGVFAIILTGVLCHDWASGIVGFV